MVPILLLAAAPQMSVIDAERAFAADAQTIGQWSAFRKWSVDDATMFVPQPINAHEFLRDRKDPAKAIDWWPTAAWVSCDGTLAVDTGGWKGPDGSVGYFTTVWKKQASGGWKWIVDSGDSLKRARRQSKHVQVHVASCSGRAHYEGLYIGNMSGGAASDGSLNWHWTAKEDGSRIVQAGMWNGRRFEQMIDNRIAAEPK